MAAMSRAFQDLVEDRLGYVPEGLSAVVSPLSASQRDAFTYAWLNASDSQQERPAEEWVLRDEDRAAFEAFRTGLITVLAGVES